MPKDRFSAVWVSHTSLADFAKCARLYYLKNMYKDPVSKHKLQLMTPALALGQTVHKIIERLSNLPTDQRFRSSLLLEFEQEWQKVCGQKGGFIDSTQEAVYFERGTKMLERVMRVKGPLQNLAVKVQQELPSFWLSEDDNIILCGKIDWLEYLPDSDSVHIIDFKTSKTEEDGASLQLPIYYLLVHHCQHRKVSKASYWYLELSDELQPKELPFLEVATETVLRQAKQLKLARQLNLLKCKDPQGCKHCLPFEKILAGEGDKVAESEYGHDIYVLPRDEVFTKASQIL